MRGQWPQFLFSQHKFAPLFLLRLILGTEVVQKDFPSELGHHPSSSFTVLQCYTRGNPFKARERLVGEKAVEKGSDNVVLLEQTWRPPTGLITLTIPTNPLVDSVILMEQRLPLFGRTPPRLGPGWP